MLRRLECSVLGSHLSEVSTLNTSILDPPHKNSLRIGIEPPHSRTITPEPAAESIHSPGSLSVSENYSVLDSLNTDRVCGLTLVCMLQFRAFCVELSVFGPDVIE